ncbi:MAG: carboxypeptidase regulatory-like domain-containing protein [Planctomycetota bacterium]
MLPRPHTILALLAAGLLALLGWSVTRGPGGATSDIERAGRLPAGASDPGSEPGSEGVDGVEVVAVESKGPKGRLEVVAPANAAPPSNAAAEAVLRGRVVSEIDGAPLHGAEVLVTLRMHSEFWIPDAVERLTRESVATARTDHEGRFQVDVPPARPLDLEVRARDHATARRDHLFAGDDIEVGLSAAAILEGLLTRAPDGSPVEGAEVRCLDERRTEQRRVRTGLGGRFLFDDLQPGLVTVEITPRDAAVPPSRSVELQAGVRTRLDLELRAGVRIEGVVSDPDGRPIADAEVGLGASFQRSVRTDLHGWYELVGLGGARRRDLGDVRARAVGRGSERRRLGDDELTEDTRMDFVLHPARIATGRVVDPDGVPIDGVYVAGVGSKTVDGVSRSDWDASLTGPDGRFELRSLHLLIDHQLFLRKAGHGTRVYDFPADESARERIDHGDLVLHPAGRIEGVLRDSGGAPLPDHLVKLRGANGDLGRFRPDHEALKGTWVTAVRHSRTDTRGQFHFADLPGGELQVTATVPGRPEAKAEATVALPEGGSVDGIELTLEHGVPITGVVRAPDGSPATGVFVQVAGGEDQPRIRARSGAGGRFELLGVTEDMGEVELFTIVASYNWSHPDAPLGGGSFVTARAGDTDVVMELRSPVTMSGRVETADGRPAASVQVLAYRAGGARVPAAVLARATTDADGAFELELPEECLVDLVTAPSPAKADADASDTTPPDAAVLEFVASDATGVVLGFAK